MFAHIFSENVLLILISVSKIGAIYKSIVDIKARRFNEFFRNHPSCTGIT